MTVNFDKYPVQSQGRTDSECECLLTGGANKETKLMIFYYNFINVEDKY